jgi:hypothetical protein
MNSLDKLNSLLILVICYNKTVAAGDKKGFYSSVTAILKLTQ